MLLAKRRSGRKHPWYVPRLRQGLCLGLGCYLLKTLLPTLLLVLLTLQI